MSPGSPVAHEAWDLKLEALRASRPVCTIIISGFECGSGSTRTVGQIMLILYRSMYSKASELQDT